MVQRVHRESQSLARFGCSGESSRQKSAMSDGLSVGYVMAHGGFGPGPRWQRQLTNPTVQQVQGLKEPMF